MTEKSENQPIRTRYRFQYLQIEMPDRPPSEIIEWLTGLVKGVTDLCEAQLLSLVDVESFQGRVAADAEALAGAEGASAARSNLTRALQLLDESHCARVAHASQGQTPRVSLDDWLEFCRHIDHARWASEESCLSWRYELSVGSIPENGGRVLQCIQEIEKRIPVLRSCRVADGPAQHDAIEKCAILNAQLLGEAGEVSSVADFSKAIVHYRNRWAAFLEALIEGRWIDSRTPRAYLNTATSRIYPDVRPDLVDLEAGAVCDGLGQDSQGFKHSAGSGGKIKGADALHGLNATKQDDAHPQPEELTFDHKPLRSDCISVEEIVGEEEPVKALQERRFTEYSVAELEKAASEEPRLARYIQAIVHNPRRKRADIWKDLGLSEEDGRAIDRKYRRLRKRLKDSGACMEWREMPTPGGSASQTVFFETLYDGAKGSEKGVWQHKYLKTEEK